MFSILLVAEQGSEKSILDFAAEKNPLAVG
jgi:hypothetical protein